MFDFVSFFPRAVMQGIPPKMKMCTCTVARTSYITNYLSC